MYPQNEALKIESILGGTKVSKLTKTCFLERHTTLHNKRTIFNYIISGHLTWQWKILLFYTFKRNTKYGISQPALSLPQVVQLNPTELPKALGKIPQTQQV